MFGGKIRKISKIFSYKFSIFKAKKSLYIAWASFRNESIKTSNNTHMHNPYTQGAKSLYLAKKGLEVTSPAIVVLNAFLDSSDLPKEGLSGLLWKFFWRDALIRRYLDILFVIQLKFSTQLYYEQSYL